MNDESTEKQHKPGISRRRFMALGGVVGTLLATGAFSLETRRMTGTTGMTEWAPIIRPPGALEEAEFLATCLKCGQCRQNCPYDAIKMGGAGLGAAIGTPYLTVRDVPCYLCPDLPCITACPSGALDPKVTDIRQANMGIAVITDREDCFALKGNRCEVCYRSCPLMGKAISIVYRKDAKAAMAVFEPVVHKDACVGCGKCEHACILETPAIKVFPRGTVARPQGV